VRHLGEDAGVRVRRGRDRLRRFEHGAVVRVEANVEIAEFKLVGLRGL
jgi:hypothetical protein